MASFNGTSILGLLLSWVLLAVALPMITLSTKKGGRLRTCFACLFLGGFGSLAGGILGFFIFAQSQENLFQMLPPLLGLAGGIKLGLMSVSNPEDDSP